MANRLLILDHYATGKGSTSNTSGLPVGDGSLYYLILGTDGGTLQAKTNSGIVEDPAGSMVYQVSVPTWWAGEIIWYDGSNKLGADLFDAKSTEVLPPDTSPVTVPVLSLSSVSDANAYFAGRLYATAYTAASSDSKQQALNDATRILNRFAYKGWLTVNTQQNAWPRSGVYIDRIVIDPTTIPAPIIEAQYEIAFAMLKGYDPERDARNASVVSRGYSSVRVAYAPNLSAEYFRWGVPSAAAWNLILPFLDVGEIESIQLHRVS